MPRTLVLALIAAALLSGCGFQPLYATNGDAGAGLRSVALGELAVPEEIRPLVKRAFERRTSSDPSSAAYDLTVSTTERAQRLAVQIDASVTRYNYRLVGRYILVERATGARYRGDVTSIASFNVVNSQYSTLFAEDAAREKAATQLVEDIERDILLKLSNAEEKARRARQ